MKGLIHLKGIHILIIDLINNKSIIYKVLKYLKKDYIFFFN